MALPESRRFGSPSGKSPDPTRSKIRPSPTGSGQATPKAKTTRRVPKTTRWASGEESGDERAAILAAAQGEARAKNQLALTVGLVGGGFLLLVIIAIAASSGSSASTRETGRRTERRAAAAPPEPPPPPPPKAHNYVRNTGGIVFVCGGSEKHPDREVVLSACPKCPSRNGFSWDEAASGYRCSSCKTVYENSAIKCDQCGRTPRVTHLKKTGVPQTP